MLVEGGISILMLAHEEAAAQEALHGAVLNAPPAARMLPWLRHKGAELLRFAASNLTQPLAHTLAQHGVVHNLLQVSCQRQCCTSDIATWACHSAYMWCSGMPTVGKAHHGSTRANQHLSSATSTFLDIRAHAQQPSCTGGPF